ncbi:MAG: alkene reductase [Lewinellaceae bacterium]|nr:alkene reductase [Lewinellaceae bacterium]
MYRHQKEISMQLFSSTKLGPIHLSNHIVMAPMTRSRAIGNIPNDLMAEYYAQRASAGLIITEGTSPSPNGLGYPRIPGAFSAEQVEGWKKITDAVHNKGGKIFLQLMHVGRIAHPLNLPEGAEVVAPSAIAAKGEMYTDQEGPKGHPVPKAMNTEEVKATVQEYVQAARNAIEAGFDGVELHGANGYLIEQFINQHVNQRTDEYGGSVENRSRFLLEIAEQTSAAIGKERVGVRLSPYGAFNDMPAYDGVEEDYTYLTEQLNDIGIAYIHLVDHSSMGAPEVPDSIKEMVRTKFANTLILSGGYDAERAEADLQAGKAGLIAFGKPFLANPDLVERFRQGAELNDPDFSTFYTPGEKGYTDYPVLEEVEAGN